VTAISSWTSRFPDAPFASPSGYDEEFESGTIGGFTFSGAGTYSATTLQSHVTMTFPSSGGYGVLHKTIPNTLGSFTMWMKYEIQGAFNGSRFVQFFVGNDTAVSNNVGSLYDIAEVAISSDILPDPPGSGDLIVGGATLAAYTQDTNGITPQTPGVLSYIGKFLGLESGVGYLRMHFNGSTNKFQWAYSSTGLSWVSLPDVAAQYVPVVVGMSFTLNGNDGGSLTNTDTSCDFFRLVTGTSIPALGVVGRSIIVSV
jgi:hypothetical protein